MEQNKKAVMKSLVEKGKQKGTLTNNEIMEALEELDLDLDQTEKFYDTLQSMGIEVVGYLDNDGEVIEIESEVEKYESAEDMEKMLTQEGLPIDDPVRMYLKEIGQFPLLDGERELYLAQRMADGDEKAKRELVTANLRLVVSIAKR